MSSTATRSDDPQRLAGRISAASSFAEALSTLIDGVFGGRGLSRVAALVWVDGDWRGVTGFGWKQQTIRETTVPAYSALHPLIRAAAAGGLTVVQDGEPLLGLERYAVLVITAPGSEQPLALLAFDPQTQQQEQLQQIADEVLPLEPVLRRMAEVDGLRQSVHRLEQRQEMLSLLVNALPDPVLVTDSDNNLLLENRRAESLFTPSDSDSEGRRRAVEINNLLFSSFLTRATIGGRARAARELNLVDPSEGTDLLFEILSTPTSSWGTADATMSVLRDVTDLKRATTEVEHQFKRVRQAELKARSERDRLNLILENVGDPILVTDVQSNIILMNREAERLFETPAGVNLDARRRQDVRTNDTKFSSFISDFALGTDGTRTAELQLSDPESGTEFPAEVVSGKVVDERSDKTAIVSIIHDLSKVVENKRLAAELSRLNEGLESRIHEATEELAERNRRLEWQSEELERAYRLKSEFLASMSHELRTPINALLGYTSLIRDRIYGELTDRQDEALARMASASHHLLELVNDILDLAKIEAGKMPVHVAAVSVEQLIRDLSQTIEPMVRRKQLEYRVDVEPNLPVLETDATKVKQILLNLLSNAVKFTQQGSISVRVTAAPHGNGVHIAVADTGIGIKTEDQEKVFDDFRQADQSSTREYGGTGLGLSITKKLLNLLGGTVRLESCPGEGSTFSIWLPTHSQEMRKEEELARARNADEVVVTDSDQC